MVQLDLKDVLSHSIVVCLQMYSVLQELQQGGLDVAIGNLMSCIPSPWLFSPTVCVRSHIAP